MKARGLAARDAQAREAEHQVILWGAGVVGSVVGGIDRRIGAGVVAGIAARLRILDPEQRGAPPEQGK